MLDEIMEVKTYLENPTANNVRLNAKLLSDNFRGNCKLVGIADILTLIACHYMYDFRGAIQINREIELETILIMRIWCGFENDVTEEELLQAKSQNKEWFQTYPNADGWLRTYHSIYLHQGGNWSKYCDEWKSKLNSSMIYRAEKLGYENILAQAAARGPLKKWYLVMDKSYEDITLREIKNSKGKKLDVRKQRSLTKILAAYLVLKQLHPKQEYILSQTNRILYWLGYDSYKKDRLCLDLTWNNSTLIEEYNDYADFKKIRVNPEFVKMLKFKLIEDPAECSENCLVFQDVGHGKENELKKLK